MHCTKCGTAVPESAAFCPSCGQAQASTTSTPYAAEPHKKGSRKLLGCFGIGVGAFILLAIIGSQMPNQTDASGTGKAADATANAEPADLPIAVTATELFNAYANNEATAQSYFGDRTLLVSGTVEKVTLDFMDKPVALLKTPNEFMSAQAALADDAESEAGSFNPGNKVKLLCDGVSEVVSTPMLKDCRTAPPGMKSQPVNGADK